jgi:ELWxxDGT repeat protein
MWFTTHAGELYFSAFTAATGQEVWKVRTDGVAVPVIDLEAGAGNSNPSGFASHDGELYFTAFRSDVGFEPWKVRADGGVVLVGDLRAGREGSNPSEFTEHDGEIYFSANNGTAGGELLYRITDGGAPALVDGLEPGFGPFAAGGLTSFRGELYFIATNFLTGSELWKVRTDGVAVRVADIAPQNLLEFDRPAASRWSSPRCRAMCWSDAHARGSLYFGARGAPDGHELWRIGTSGPPVLVADIDPGPASSFPMEFATLSGDVLV